MRRVRGYTLVEIVLVIAAAILLSALGIRYFGQVQEDLKETMAVEHIKTVISAAHDFFKAEQSFPQTDMINFLVDSGYLDDKFKNSLSDTWDARLRLVREPGSGSQDEIEIRQRILNLRLEGVNTQNCENIDARVSRLAGQAGMVATLHYYIPDVDENRSYVLQPTGEPVDCINFPGDEAKQTVNLFMYFK